MRAYALGASLRIVEVRRAWFIMTGSWFPPRVGGDSFAKIGRTARTGKGENCRYHGRGEGRRNQE